MDVAPAGLGVSDKALGGIEMAGPAYFAPDYRGIMAVLFTEFSGHQPVIATFNLGEKKGAAQVEFASVTPGTATAQLKAYNPHISKLNLAKRFPLNKVLLKKCAGGPAQAPRQRGRPRARRLWKSRVCADRPIACRCSRRKASS